MRTCTKCKIPKEENKTNFQFITDKNIYQSICRICLNERRRFRFNNNAEYQAREKQRHVKWYWENRDAELKKLRERQDSKREFYQEINRQSYHRNKHKSYNITRSKFHMNKFRAPDLENNFSYEEWLSCLESFNYSCAYCGIDNKKLDQEHFIPVNKGGSYTAKNIVPSCRDCNLKKRNKDFFEWYPMQTFFDKKRLDTIIKYLNPEPTQQLKRVV